MSFLWQFEKYFSMYVAHWRSVGFFVLWQFSFCCNYSTVLPTVPLLLNCIHSHLSNSLMEKVLSTTKCCRQDIFYWQLVYALQYIIHFSMKGTLVTLSIKSHGLHQQHGSREGDCTYNTVFYSGSFIFCKFIVCTVWCIGELKFLQSMLVGEIEWYQSYSSLSVKRSWCI